VGRAVGSCHGDAPNAQDPDPGPTPDPDPDPTSCMVFMGGNATAEFLPDPIQVESCKESACAPDPDPTSDPDPKSDPDSTQDPDPTPCVVSVGGDAASKLPPYP
jgi:hypothetical protein